MKPLSFSSIHHDGSVRYVQASNGLVIGSEVILRVRAGADVPIRSIFLRTAPDGEEALEEMQPEETEGGTRWWRARLRLSMPSTHYRFLIILADGEPLWLDGGGVRRGWITDYHDFRILAGYEAPEWVTHSVFYQIFPDRFANGDPSNDVRDGEYVYRDHKARHREWGEPLTVGAGALVEFFGGDLQGIQQHLDYLDDLGVNAIYLNPVFTAYSNHRYDVTDYDNVDPHLGGNRALADLRQALNERGMRMMLDIVPNHCGFMHPWFQDAFKDPNAETAEFFTFFEHPNNYASWLGVRTLPKLNYASQKLREWMYRDADSVFRRWMKPPFSIDGWRIDVANMLGRQGSQQLGEEVGREIRAAVKDENPEAYLLGENFFDATHQLQGNFLDAVMNYSGFNKALLTWLGMPLHAKGLHVQVKVSTEALVESWANFMAPIPWQIAMQQLNLLDSHDTPRALQLLGFSEPLLRAALAVLLTFPGVPCIYYGDEVGIGTEENTSRACMEWDSAKWNTSLRDYVKRLAHLRRESTALAEGGFQVLAAEPDTLAYLRDHEAGSLLVIAHRGFAHRQAGGLPVSHGGFADGAAWRDVFTGQTFTIQYGELALPELETGAMVLEQVTG